MIGLPRLVIRPPSPELRAIQPYQPQDRPAIELYRDVMARFRPEMRRYYYEPSKYRT